MGSSIFSILSAGCMSPGAMARLCFLALLVLSAFTTNSSANTLRVERDACDDKDEELEACRLGAYEEYKEAFAAGDDGRPDWLARKSCNYMTKTIEECSEGMVGECMTEEEVHEMKDHQLKGILEQLSATINEWDSQKCPAMKAHLDRTNAAEEEEETPEGVEVDSAAQEKEEEKEEDKKEEGEEDKEEEEEEEKDTGASEETPDTLENETPEGEDGGDGEDSGDQGDKGETSEDGGDNGNGDESSEGPDSGSEAATASLSLVLILYKICSA